MTFRARPALVFALAVAGPTFADAPEPLVRDDPNVNGWIVRVSFRRGPDSYARAGHAWTRRRAVTLAGQLAQDFPEGTVAGIRVEGTNGTGKIDPVRGPHPVLADWPLVEEKFRTRTKAPLSGLEKNLAAAREAYQRAQKETEDLARPRTDIPTEREKALQQLYKSYNDRLDEIGKELKGEPLQLPRLNLPAPPYLRDYVKAWDEAKADQYQAEMLEAEVRNREADLSRQRKDIEVIQEQIRKETDPDALKQLRQSLQDAEARYERTDTALKEDRKAADELTKATDARMNSLANRLADTSAIPPQADAFTSTGGAAYSGDDTPQVYKTGKDGKPLPDDQQPTGYPKRYDPGDQLAADEKAMVEPSLKVRPLDRVPEDVKAPVYGKVTEIDKKNGSMTVQVDESGTKLQFLGLNPEGVEPGTNIEPWMVVGTWRNQGGPQGTYRLVIRAVNSRNQLVRPGPVLNYGRQKPVESGSLKRPTPEVESPPADGSGKAKLPADGGKGEPNYKVVMDDSVGKDGRKRFGYDESNLKEKALEAKKTVAKKELDRQKENADRLRDEAGLLKNKVRDADRDLETARTKIDAINKESRQLVTRARELADRQKELEAEEKELKADKADLDREGARVKAGKDNKQIDAFNKKVERHNAKAERLEEKFQRVKRQKEDLQKEVRDARRQRDLAEQQEARAKREKERVQSDLRDAEAKAKTAQDAAVRQQDTLNSLEAEQQRLRDQIKALGAKTDAEKGTGAKE